MPDVRPRSNRVIAGIFVGGRGSRMGGAPKGLLVTRSGETIVARWRRLFDAMSVEVVLVGAHDAYAGLGLARLVDEPAGIGPLGGLVALLQRGAGADVIAVAGDMPYVSPEFLARLVSSSSPAAAVAPRRDGIWEPLFARYASERALEIARRRAAEGQTSLQRLLDDLQADTLSVSPQESEQLHDWDHPEDMSKDG